jgi:hypothetical protein
VGIQGTRMLLSRGHVEEEQEKTLDAEHFFYLNGDIFRRKFV